MKASSTVQQHSRKIQLKKFAATLKKEYGPVGQIVGLAKKGFTRKEIIELGGYNKNTVYCQHRKYIGLATK